MIRPTHQLLTLAFAGALGVANLVSAAEQPANAAAQAELEKLQGLWLSTPGAMERWDGNQQLVRQRPLGGPCGMAEGQEALAAHAAAPAAPSAGSGAETIELELVSR